MVAGVEFQLRHQAFNLSALGLGRLSAVIAGSPYWSTYSPCITLTCPSLFDT